MKLNKGLAILSLVIAGVVTIALVADGAPWPSWASYTSPTVGKSAAGSSPWVQAQASQKGPPPTASRWKRVPSPQGRLSVEVPEGWEIKQMNPEENPVLLGPAGRNFPSVSINGWVTPETIQMMLMGQSDNRFQCHQVSVKELYERLFLPLLRQKLPDLRIERMIPSNPTTRGRVEGSVTYQGQRYRLIDTVVMEYLADPTLALVAGCPQPWYSLAFIGSVMASPQEMAVLEPVSERIFSTFRPTPRWGAEVVEAIINGMQTRTAMMSQTAANIARMEMDQRMQEIQSGRRINQRWIDTLGGVYRYKDPDDPSYEGTIHGSKIPSGPTRWWRCGNQPPVASSGSPGYGCRETPAPH